MIETDSKFELSIDSIKKLIQMRPEEKLEFIEWAQMFGLMPQSQSQYVHRFIARMKAVILDKNDLPQTVIIQGGVDALHESIRSQFPHIISMISTWTQFSDEAKQFFASHDIDKDDYLVCGTGEIAQRVAYICFRHLSDAVLAKLFFEDCELTTETKDESVQTVP